MSMSDPYSPPPARPAFSPALGLLCLVVAVLAGAALGGVAQAWLFGARPGAVSDPGAAATRPVTPRGDLAPAEQSIIAVYEQTSPSVVHITTLAVRRDAFTRDLQAIPQGTGSGFVWDAEGHVVTNFHVVRDSNVAAVTLADHSTWEAQVVGRAPDKDLAVLRVNAPPERLPPILVGESANLQVGQTVLAIGNPFGLDQTLTTGVISGLERQIDSLAGNPIDGVIQTDAAINPGNSGGPLLDSAGRLIGVNTAIQSPSGAYAGVGFAVPVDIVKRIVPELVEHGRVIRPGLAGVTFFGDRTAEQLRARGAIAAEGVIIADVEPRSAAAGAGLEPTRRYRNGAIQLGDMIVAIDGQPIRDHDDLYRALDGREVGDTVELTILRGRQEQRVSIALEELRG
jgi:S1-C subfamily serine protease